MNLSEAEILGAINRREFFPVFQPIVELRTGKLAGFEVLARWNRNGHGLTLPDEFIPAVEAAGQIRTLSRSILSQAFAAVSSVDSDVALSFNLSTTQLMDAGLPHRLEATAAEQGFPLRRLTIEITESALVDDLERACEVANALKELGCRLALDDFGTGYSSLKHLHSLPFDELKIDRSFVQSMKDKRESRKIVASVISLGHSLELITVAEGIETAEQAEMLFWMGCNYGQGWFYGRPGGREEIPGMLTRTLIVRGDEPASEINPGLGVTLESVPAHRLAQLQAIYDGAPVGLCFLDRQLRYVSLNQQLARMNGVPAAEHIGRRVADVIPQVFPSVEGFIRRALAGESLSGLEVTKPAVNGKPPQTVMLSYQPVRDELGEVVGVAVAVTDITERKQTEEALRERDHRYRQIVALSPHVTWILDARGGVMHASPRWEELTGQPLDQAMRDGWLDVLHPDDVPATVEAIRQALEFKLPIDVRYRIRRPGADWKWMRARGSPQQNGAGQVAMIYGVVEELEHSDAADVANRGSNRTVTT